MIEALTEADLYASVQQVEIEPSSPEQTRRKKP